MEESSRPHPGKPEPTSQAQADLDRKQAGRKILSIIRSHLRRIPGDDKNGNDLKPA
jgi:hypothetical protein